MSENNGKCSDRSCGPSCKLNWPRGAEIAPAKSAPQADNQILFFFSPLLPEASVETNCFRGGFTLKASRLGGAVLRPAVLANSSGSNNSSTSSSAAGDDGALLNNPFLREAKDEEDDEEVVAAAVPAPSGDKNGDPHPAAL